jgi:hypothetical protein
MRPFRRPDTRATHAAFDASPSDRIQVPGLRRGRRPAPHPRLAGSAKRLDGLGVELPKVAAAAVERRVPGPALHRLAVLRPVPEQKFRDGKRQAADAQNGDCDPPRGTLEDGGRKDDKADSDDEGQSSRKAVVRLFERGATRQEFGRISRHGQPPLTPPLSGRGRPRRTRRTAPRRRAAWTRCARGGTGRPSATARRPPRTPR